MFTIGRSADSWNEHAKRNHIRSFVEREWHRQLERTLLPQLKGNELHLMIFIKGRTLGWQKFAEAIPMQHFIEGLLDEEGEVRLGSDMRPYCSGTGIKKDDTIRAILKRLDRRGLITKAPGPRGFGLPVNVFMPFSQDWLAKKIIEAGGGVLPVHTPGHFVGEHVRTSDGNLWEVVVTNPPEVGLVRVLKPGHYTGDHSVAKSSEVNRLPLTDWMEISGEKRT